MAYLSIGADGFDASTVEPSKPREVIPPGEYTAIVEASDVKPTKKAKEDIQYGGPAANDKLLELTLKVIEGEFAGSMIWERMNIVNVNPQAQEIAQRDLSALCHAVGKLKVKDSAELHNKPIRIKVDVEKKEGYNPRNVVKGYSPLGGASAAQASSVPAAAATPAWGRK